jgi:hypothetical protein
LPLSLRIALMFAINALCQACASQQFGA